MRIVFNGNCRTLAIRRSLVRPVKGQNLAHNLIVRGQYPRLLSTTIPLRCTVVTNEAHNKNGTDEVLLGDTLIEEGKLEEALVEYSKMVLMNPYDPRYAIKKATTLQRLSRWQDAIDEYKKVLFLVTVYTPTLTAIGICQGKLGKLPDALKTLDEAIYLDNKYVPALLERAHIHHERGSMEEAIKDVERVRNIEPDNIDHILTLAELKMDFGKVEEAKSLYDNILAIDTHNKPANVGKGIIAYTEGKFSLAVSLFTKSLGDQRDNADLLIKRASALCNLNNFEAAEKDIQEALVLEPSNPTAFMIRGQIYMHNKRYEAAIQDLTQFLNDCERSYANIAVPPPEEIMLRSLQKSSLLEKIGDCHLELFWHTHQKLKTKLNRPLPGGEGDTVDETFVYDLKKRLDISKDKHLLGAFMIYIKSRTELKQAKITIDPKLHKLKLIVNEILRE